MPSAERVRLVTMNPTRGHNSLICHSTLATAWRFVPALCPIGEAGKVASHLVRRSPNGVLEQATDPILQDSIGLQPECSRRSLRSFALCATPCYTGSCSLTSKLSLHMNQ